MGPHVGAEITADPCSLFKVEHVDGRDESDHHLPLTYASDLHYGGEIHYEVKITYKVKFHFKVKITL